jgi:DNA-binding beta-propeller fold protein YncE
LSRRLLVIDPKKRTVEAAIATEGTGHWVAVLPDASKAYVTNKDDKPFVSVIDLKARKLVRARARSERQRRHSSHHPMESACWSPTTRNR